MFNLSSGDNHVGGLPGLISRIFLRLLQLAMAITVCGLYGADIHDKSKPTYYDHSKWLYAVVVGAMSATTTFVYALPLLKSWYLFCWDTVLFVLWVAVFGVFGKIFIHANSHSSALDGGVNHIQTEKIAVWIDLVNMLLWFITAVYGAVLFFMYGRARTLHIDRAVV